MADIHGTFDERFAPVADVLSANLDAGKDVGASVCVVHDGQTVVDIWGGRSTTTAPRGPRTRSSTSGPPRRR